MTEGTNNVLQVLVAERDRLDQAIAVLQGGLPAQVPKRRGRPPGSKTRKMTQEKNRTLSDAARKALSARMKKHWAQRRKEKAAAKS